MNFHNIKKQQFGSKRICKCKYKMRWFYSKGAFLVLVWIFLSTLTISLSIRTAQIILSRVSGDFFDWFCIVPISIGALTVLPLGWLANTKFGVYNAIKFGHILLFVTMFLTSAYTLLLDYDFAKNNQYLFGGILFCFIGSLYTIGMAAFVVSVLQLGLDQMPDASSSNITSFIAWILFSIFTSLWISDTLYFGHRVCLKKEDDSYPTSSIQLWSLIPTSCISLVIATDFLFAKKWLIIEPKTSQTLKTAYKVLKFAWKHKAPVNRSAFTYWEENVPSRMDLGKSRYGGPFTTEQVEDVKTVLRLLILSLPLWVLSFSVMYAPISNTWLVKKIVLNSNWTSCNAYALYACTCKTIWCVLITTLLFEFAIYPIVRDRLPSILKRIGITAFVNFVLSVLFLILSLVYHFSEDARYVSMWMLSVLFSISRGVEICFLFSGILDLVCAQTPYTTRGFFTGYFTVCILASGSLGSFLSDNHPKFCTDRNIQLILFGVKCFISLFGLVVYCLLARWYKRRVRDEEYCTQTVVEEVYDRYLSATSNN